MARIQQLDPHVADLIAAGEVVERPASVVKELTENAIDAGAHTVTVEIQRGGVTYIRVTDDGCGIEEEDCLLAFLRHATSKIRTEHDLDAIGTLGFRGEALAAIASVSRVEMMTRTETSDVGTAVRLEGGTLRGREEVGCPRGTTMIVRDLFFNTPARQKFLKRDSAEGSAVTAVVQHAALSHPEVSFRFIREGKQELQTPGDGELKSAVYAVLGRDIALGMLECHGRTEEVTVTGFVSRPVCCRGSRGGQIFFVNGRYVKSRIMQAALEQAYQNQKMVGKFPACVLHVTTRPGSVDVNIHPTKTEVKFLSEKRLFDAVYYSVKAVLDTPDAPPEATLAHAAPPSRQDTVTPNQVTWDSGPRDRVPVGTHVTAVPAPGPAACRTEDLPRRDSAPAAAHQPVRQAVRPAVSRTEVRPVTERPTPPEEPAPTMPVPEVLEPEQPVPEEIRSPGSTEPDWRLVGEVLHTYLIVEQGDEVWFIDKHAAHERMNFDALKAMHHTPMSQLLLQPLMLRPAPEECAALLGALPLLEEFGFSAEDFGGGTLLVRQAPDYLPADQIESALEEIAERLLTCGTADPDAARDQVLHTMACKAAIKGGWQSAREELLALCQAVMSGQVRYCPHGRPVAVRLARKDFEKEFKRT